MKAHNLSSLVLPFLDTDPGSLHFVPLRTGKHNQSYWINCDQGRFVLRVAPADDAGFLFYEKLMMRQEPELHALIRERTQIPVAKIIGYDFSRTRIDRDYLLLEALPGQPLSDIAVTRHQFERTLYQVGQYLRELHALTAQDCLGSLAFGYLGSHQPMVPQATWFAAFKVMWDKLLDDVVACGSYTPEEGRSLSQLLDLHAGSFDHPVTAQLLHMDIWSQNILVDAEGHLTGLVDFDRALWGDAEIEFAVLDYCGISEPAFWEGYGSQRDQSLAAHIRQQFYLLYEVQKYMPIRVWRRNNPQEAERYRQYALSLAAQLIPR